MPSFFGRLYRFLRYSSRLQGTMPKDGWNQPFRFFVAAVDYWRRFGTAIRTYATPIGPLIPKKRRSGFPSRPHPTQPFHFEQASRKQQPEHAIGDGAG